MAERSAFVDTFINDNLPPRGMWPEMDYSVLPELAAYPPRLNAAVELLDQQVAAGYADIAVDAGLQSYDIVALIPIIEKAGGVVTTFEGGPAEAGGDIIAAASPELHEAAMKAIQGKI